MAITKLKDGDSVEFQGKKYKVKAGELKITEHSELLQDKGHVFFGFNHGSSSYILPLYHEGSNLASRVNAEKGKGLSESVIGFKNLSTINLFHITDALEVTRLTDFNLRPADVAKLALGQMVEQKVVSETGATPGQPKIGQQFRIEQLKDRAYHDIRIKIIDGADGGDTLAQGSQFNVGVPVITTSNDSHFALLDGRYFHKRTLVERVK